MYNQLLAKQILMKWDCETFLDAMAANVFYESTVALQAIVTALRYILA